MMTFSSLKIVALGILLATILISYWYRSLPSYSNNQPLTTLTIENETAAQKEKSGEAAIIDAIKAKTINPISETAANEIALSSEISAQTSPTAEAITYTPHREADPADEPIAQPLQPEQYEAEEIDAYWAFEKETYYIDLFSETESLSGFVLSEAQCQSRQCKLSFLLANQEQKDEITNRLMEKLMAESQDLRVSLDLNSSSDEAVLYIEDVKEF